MLDPFEMFKVLGVETRVRIVELLKSKGPLGAKNIAAELGITPAAVSQHLKVLKQAGLVSNERKGYWIPYSIDEEAMENCCGMLVKVCTCGCKGAGGHRKQEPGRVTLAALRKHEQELKSELGKVQKKISRIRARKK